MIVLSQVCTVEETKSVHLLMTTVGVEPGFLCDTLIPALQFLVKTLTIDMATLTEALFETIIGDPSTYNVSFSWYGIIFILILVFLCCSSEMLKENKKKQKIKSPPQETA